MKIYKLLILFLIPFCFLEQGLTASAKIQGLLVQADDIYRDSEKDIVHLKGNIQVIYKLQTLKSDEAFISLKNRTIEAVRNVELVDPKTTIQGERIVLDYENSTGVIYNGIVQSGSVIFEGRILEKLGPSEYFVTDSSYTTCTNCPSTWSFDGASIRAELGGYAYIKNSWLKVGSIPVLWLPYLIVPLKSDRQTGFLNPSIEGSGTGGLAISESFFWVISPSTDATITYKQYEFRGPKLLLNYRYMLSPTSFGELDTGMIQDRYFKDETRNQKYQSTEEKGKLINRWFFKYSNYFDLPEGYTQRTQINLVDDIQYPKDYDEETKNSGDPAIENRVSISKNDSNSHTHIDTSYYINMLHGNPFSNNDDSVHRLPEVQYNLVPQYIGETEFLYSLDINFTNFSRNGPSWDDIASTTDSNGKTIRYRRNSCNDPKYENNPNCHPTDDGTFDPFTDVIRTGQRFDIMPTLYRPLKIAEVIDVLPQISYRETHYNFSTSTYSSNIRRALRGSIDAKTRFSRVYGDLENLKGNRVKHYIQPEISYTVSPWVNNSTHPFFGFTQQNEIPTYNHDSVSDGDLSGDFGLQFDYKDRIYDKNLFTFTLTNQWIEKYWNVDIPEYRQFALFKISQSYDLNEAQRNSTNPQPWSDILAQLTLKFDHFSTTATANYYPYQRVTDSTSSMKIWDSWGRFLQLGISRKYQITRGISDVDIDTRNEDYTIDAGFTSSHLNLMSRLVIDGNPADHKSRQKLKGWAYIAQIKPPGDCWAIQIKNYLPVGSDPRINIDFQFTFDGKPISPLPSSEIESLTF